MSVLQFAVFGHPIAHSLSPRIHQAFARQCGIELEFRAVDVTAENFKAVARGFFDGGGRGANVTSPHKAAAFRLADVRSVAATRVGTANVLSRDDAGRLAAHNTDGDGFMRDLAERHGIDVRGQDTLLLGAGGAARGVAWHLLDAGARTLTIVNRSPVAAAALAEAIDEPARVHVSSWDALAASGSYDLIVNATSAGLLGVTLPLPLSLAGPGTACYDLSYGEAAGGFLRWARTAGARYACDGLGMLLETAADAFALWHGPRPDTKELYQTLRAQTA
jgi:shikimate dehydrogenase